MDFASLKAVNAARRERRAVMLVTDLDRGLDQVIQEGDTVGADLAAAVAAAFRSGKSGSADVETGRFFLNVHLPPPRIVVIGAVHISQPLAIMAAIAGFDLVIIDPRTAFATPERFEGIDLLADWPADALALRPLDAYTALVAVTHDPKIDDFPIAEALRTGCFYVGALGSRKTHAKRVERLKADAVSDVDIARISAPIGLDIGAASPAEIAVAILAEVIQAFHRRSLGSQQGATA